MGGSHRSLAPLIPALRMQRQIDLYEFQASQSYTVKPNLNQYEEEEGKGKEKEVG